MNFLIKEASAKDFARLGLIPVGVPWAHPVRGASQVYLGFTSFLTPGGVPVRFTFDIGELRVPPLTNTLPW